MPTTDEELLTELLSPTVSTAEVRRQLGLTADAGAEYRAIPRQRHDATALPYVKESQPIHAAAG